MRVFLFYTLLLQVVQPIFAQRPLVFRVIDPDPISPNFNPVGNTIVSYDSFYIFSSNSVIPTTLTGQQNITKVSLNGERIKNIELCTGNTEIKATRRPIKTDRTVTYPIMIRDFDQNGTFINRGGGLTRIDTALSVELQTDYRSTPYQMDFVHRVVQTPDSGYLQNISLFYRPDYPNERLLKTDKDGNILWHKEIPHLNYTYSGDFVQTHDGNYLTAAYSTNLTAIPPFGFTQRVVLTKITPEADVIWQKQMQPIWRSRDLQPYLTTFPNGDIGYLFLNDSLATELAEEWRLYLLDSLANIRWQTDFRDFTVGKAIYRINSASNGDIIGCGAVGDYLPNGLAIDYGWVFRISRTGERLWSRFYSSEQLFPNSRKLIFHDIEETTDGRLALTGFIDDWMPPGRSNPILAVLDENGCLDPNNCNGTGVNIIVGTENVQTETRYKLQASPNPTKGNVEISFSEHLPLSDLTIEIRSLIGRLIAIQSIINLNTSLDLSSHPTGAYFLVLRKRGIVIDYTKIILNN
jgi:Secretion system C-terminal sorting domain